MATAGTSTLADIRISETHLNVEKIIQMYEEPGEAKSDTTDYVTKTHRYAPNYMRIWDSNGFPETNI